MDIEGDRAEQFQGTTSESCSLVKGLFYVKKILDPGGTRTLYIFSVIAILLDPLFFYIPVINDDKKCVGLDKNLSITASVLRSFFDLVYVIYFILRLSFDIPTQSNWTFGSCYVHKFSRKYLFSSFLIELLAILPLPQVMMLIMVPTMTGSKLLDAMNLMKYFVLFQYVPRIIRICLFFRKATDSTLGILTEATWAKAVFNLLLYLLASHVIGSLWYFFAIERETVCWKKACINHMGCSDSSFSCDDSSGNYTFLNDFCPTRTQNTDFFDFGIFQVALQSRVVEVTNLPQKLLRCFQWGLQSLSCFGQNLQTSTYGWENFFAISITISGVVSFLFLIGNMQIYLQSKTIRSEDMKLKAREIEQWMTFSKLSENLQQQVKKYQRYVWRETKGVDVENLLNNLPKDLRRKIKRELCLDLLKRVPFFVKMDERLLDAMCDRLKPMLYTDDSYIVREGEPVDEMLFIVQGMLLSSTTDGGRSGFYNAVHLRVGDFCGEELITWILDPQSSSNLPISTRTVRVLTEVEAFALMADDLKFVASQFRRFHSKELILTFRYYSQQWRTWAACFIQAAWRRFGKRKCQDSLRGQENRLQEALARGGGIVPSVGATICASLFASNLLRAVRDNGDCRARKLESVPSMLLQKPAEPDFNY